MNKLVLVGNGFDLAHHLKTSYRSFITWYLKGVNNSLSEINTYSDDLIKLNSNVIEIPSEDKNYIKKFVDRTKTDIKYNFPFFKTLLYKSTNSNWVDIEALYYEKLIQIYKKTNGARSDFNDIQVIQLNKCLDLIKSKLEEYLIEVEQTESDLNKVIDTYFVNLYSQFTGSRSNKALAVNFNYTNILKKYLETNSIPINYIHGKLNDPDNPIIFGYGDEMDNHFTGIESLNSNCFLDHMKSFYYLKTNNYRELMRFIDSGAFTVDIMGHSCGLSDRVLLNSVFEHGNCKEIKLYYYDKGNGENDFFEKTQEISRHFTAKAKEKMRTLIVPLSESTALGHPEYIK